jgi:DNA-3-methyladenine glycosylase II
LAIPTTAGDERLDPLTKNTLAEAARALAQRDADLARIFTVYGEPPLWRRPTGFPTLVKIILEQQVSLSSAASMLARLKSAINPFSPERFLEVGEPYLRRLGVTRQKSGFLVHLSASVMNGNLNLKRLSRMSDDEARLALTSVKGIGSWSADVYLLMAMRRSDIWPAGDLALAVAVQRLKGLAKRPGPDELEVLAEVWRPHRAVAARMLWQFYLGEKALAKKSRRGKNSTSR